MVSGVWILVMFLKKVYFWWMKVRSLPFEDTYSVPGVKVCCVDV